MFSPAERSSSPSPEAVYPRLDELFVDDVRRVPPSREHEISTSCLLNVIALLLLFATVPSPTPGDRGKVDWHSSEGGARPAPVTQGRTA